MIIEIEDRFCKAAKVFAETLQKVQRAAERGDAVHEVEEATFRALMETGRQLLVAYVQEQEEDLPRPAVIQYEGKTLHRLPERRTRRGKGEGERRGKGGQARLFRHSSF
jgi:methionine aminopeptidase